MGNGTAASNTAAYLPAGKDRTLLRGARTASKQDIDLVQKPSASAAHQRIAARSKVQMSCGPGHQNPWFKVLSLIKSNDCRY